MPLTGAAFLLRQGAQVAPGEGEGGFAAQEVVPRLAQAPAHHGFGTKLDQVDQGFHGALVARAVHERIHGFGVEPEEVGVVWADDERRSERHEVEHALAADLEVHGQAVVGRAVAVEVLAVKVFGHIAELFPGFRDLEVVAVLLLEGSLVGGVFKQVAAVVHHLAVVVVGDHVHLAVIGQQAARAGLDILDIPLRELARSVVVVVVQRDDIVAADQVAEPPGAGDRGVILAGAGGEVGHQLGEVFGEGNFDDLQRGAGGGLELVAHLVEGAGDGALLAGGVDDDGDCLVLAEAGVAFAGLGYDGGHQFAGLDDGCRLAFFDDGATFGRSGCAIRGCCRFGSGGRGGAGGQQHGANDQDG